MADHPQDRLGSESAGSSKEARLDASVPPPVKPTRSYRACTNCRTHKTKCDLGDVNNPISPPCSRCKRERKECEFAESRRGGRANIEAGLAKRKGNSEAPFDSFGAANGDPYPAIDKSRRTNPKDGFDFGRYHDLASEIHQQHQHQAGPGMSYSATMPSTRHTARSQMGSGIGEGMDTRYSGIVAYNNDTLNMPMFSSTDGSISRQYYDTLSPQAYRHPQNGVPGLPLNMGDIDMPPVLGREDFRNRDTDKRRPEIPASALPSADYSVEAINHNIPTGPSFSGFFVSPGTAPDIAIQQTTSSTGQAVKTPHGSAGDQIHTVSSTSTLEYTRRDKDNKHEKLALEDTRSMLVTSGMHNESDALQILAMAAETRNTKKRKRNTSVDGDSPSVDADERDGAAGGTGTSEGPLGSSLGDPEHFIGELNGDRGSKARRRASALKHDADPGARVTFQESASEKEDSPALPDITQFFLVDQGIVDPEQVHSLCRTFFDKHHHYFPLVPPKRIPRTTDEINAFVVREPYLAVAIIIIASKYQVSHSARRIHDQTWNIMKV
jgi:hypothetical protein